MNPKQYYRRHRKVLVVGASGALYAVGWSIGYLTPYDAASAAVLVLSAVVGGYDIVRQAYYTLRSGTVGIDSLVTVAALGAIVIGEYWEAAAVVFLFGLGSYLEGRTMRETRTAIQELLAMTPETALVRRDGDRVEVPASDVEEGETVVVRPGDRVPVDGEVIDGRSAVDQSPVTGESAPVPKGNGDEVYAGTVNQEGALDVRATETGSDTTLQRIVRRVEEAQEATSKTQSLLERFATYYTPAVVLLAVGTYAVTRDALMALTLLVIGCPGALVIGPPVSVVSAIGNAARKGVLMRGGEHLERAGAIDVVAFDKTGTLTTGEPSVVDVTGFDSDPGEVLRLAATAEKRSEHHLARAVLDAARNSDGSAALADGGRGPDGGVVVPRSIPDPDAFEVIPGEGVLARYEGDSVAVGNRALMDDRGIDLPGDVRAHARRREESGETAVYVARDGSVVGVIAIRDELREAAPDVVRTLQDAGVRTVMLTGDNERTAAAVAGAVGLRKSPSSDPRQTASSSADVDNYRAELLPEDKQRAIREFQEEGHVVAMVGDGINDAPGLATADVGIAMGAAGTDTAIESADMALMADDLERIPYAVTLSRATRRNVYENVGIAVVTVVLLVAGVLTDAVHLAGGMFVHEGSVLLVILNGMRLLRY